MAYWNYWQTSCFPSHWSWRTLGHYCTHTVVVLYFDIPWSSVGWVNRVSAALVAAGAAVTYSIPAVCCCDLVKPVWNIKYNLCFVFCHKEWVHFKGFTFVSSKWTWFAFWFTSDGSKGMRSRYKIESIPCNMLHNHEVVLSVLLMLQTSPNVACWILVKSKKKSQYVLNVYSFVTDYLFVIDHFKSENLLKHADMSRRSLVQ